jgi:hypothetical protein
MEAEKFSETLAPVYQTTRRDIPEHCNLHNPHFIYKSIVRCRHSYGTGNNLWQCSSMRSGGVKQCKNGFVLWCRWVMFYCFWLKRRLCDCSLYLQFIFFSFMYLLVHWCERFTVVCVIIFTLELRTRHFSSFPSETVAEVRSFNKECLVLLKY